MTNNDYITGASEFKVWAENNCSAEYFTNFTETFVYYQSLEGSKTLESIFTVLEYMEPDDVEGLSDDQ